MILKEPKKPLAAGYKPMGGLPHKVTDSDSWVGLATDRGVDPWWLIQYNFETRDPAEINWYLKNRVGCSRTTADGRNFRFSAAAKPGIIYVPTPQMARSVTSLKYGKFGISIEGEEAYRKQVEATLGFMARSDTGMVLLNAVKRTGKQIVISPWTGTACNATAASTDIRGATAAGEVVLKGGSSFEQMKEPSLIRDLLDLPKEPMMGTGKGSDGKVNFSPSMFGAGASGACAGVAGAPGASPSQVLFHELAVSSPTHHWRERHLHKHGGVLRGRAVQRADGRPDLLDGKSIVARGSLRVRAVGGPLIDIEGIREPFAEREHDAGADRER